MALNITDEMWDGENLFDFGRPWGYDGSDLNDEDFSKWEDEWFSSIPDEADTGPLNTGSGPSWGDLGQPNDVAIGDPDLMFNDPVPGIDGLTGIPRTVNGFQIQEDLPGKVYGGGSNTNYPSGGSFPSGGSSYPGVGGNTPDGSSGGSYGGSIAAGAAAVGGAVAGAGSNNQGNQTQTQDDMATQGNTLWDWGKKILPGVLDIYSGYASQKTSENAAEIEALARAEANDLIRNQWDDTKGALAPYGEGGQRPFEMQQELVGAKGVEAQENAYQNYRESPGVAFAREQGLRGVNQQASAQGNLGGGNRLKRLTEYSQGMALQDFNNYFNKLGSLTGVGLNASQALAGVGGQAAAGQAANVIGAGEARSQGAIAGQESYNSGLGSAWDRWSK